jgi:hypothetical protein
VEAGALAGRRVFVMPFSLALSEAEAVAIRRFVAGGGVLIADGAAGLLDEHANWRRTAALDDLFGIDGPPAEERGRRAARAGGRAAVTHEGTSWGLKAAPAPPLPVLEPQLKASGGGMALLRVGGADAVVVRRFGKGWTIYLNQLLDRYPRLRETADGEAGRSVVERVLGHVGVSPALSLTDASGRPVRRALVSRYRFGDADVFAVLDGQPQAGVRYGVDGVTRYSGDDAGQTGRDVVVRLPRAAVIVNARTGESFGRTDAVRTRLLPGEALVLAASAAAGELALSGPATTARGAHAAFEIRTGQAAAPHLVRVHVTSPDGRFLPEYAANVITDGGAARYVLPSALDDAAGAYAVVATDVLTGARAEARLRLE